MSDVCTLLLSVPADIGRDYIYKVTMGFLKRIFQRPTPGTLPPSEDSVQPSEVAQAVEEGVQQPPADRLTPARRANPSTEARSHINASIQPPELWRTTTSLPSNTTAGIYVSPETSLGVSTVYACVRLISEGCSTLPLHLYDRGTGKEWKQRATSHPVYKLINREPNPEMTAIDFRGTLTAHCALRGNAYAYILWDEFTGTPLELWPLRPDRVQPYRIDGEIWYRVELPDQTTDWLHRDDVLHIRGLSYNGLMGMSPIEIGRQSVALSVAAESYGATFFGNDARPGIVLEHPGELGEDAHSNLLESWEHRHGTLTRSQRVAVLEEGMKVREIGLSPEHAQFLQTREFQVVEVCRWFNIPPHMVQDLTRATFSNIEHQSTQYVTNSLLPWLGRWEQSLDRDLLLPSEKERYYSEHMVDHLLRGDTAARYAAYEKAIMIGMMNRNEARARENLPPYEGGDKYLVPLNMAEVGSPIDRSATRPGDEGSRSEKPCSCGVDHRSHKPQKETATKIPAAQRTAAATRNRLSSTYRPVLLDVLSRILRREANDIGRAADKYGKKGDAPGFSVWLTDFYEKHKDFYRDQLLAPMQAYADMVRDATAVELGIDDPNELQAFARAYLDTASVRHIARQEARIREITDEASSTEFSQELLEPELEKWRDNEQLAAELSLEEAVRANNAFAITLYKAHGITRKRWVAVGPSCPYCSRLNGQVTAIIEWFVPAGGEVDGGEGVPAMKITRNVGHPPVHKACDCMVTSA